MATVTLKVDDLDQTTPATETIHFAFDGSKYEIDLNGDNAKEFRDLIAKYTRVAHRWGDEKAAPPTPPLTVVKADVGKPAAQRKRAVATSTGKRVASPDRNTTRAIRTWATKQGMEVSEYGRIPAGVVRAFNQAHGVG